MRIYKEFHFEAAHFLPSAPPWHPNARVHGHSFRVRVTVDGTLDPETGLVLHFEDLESALENAREDDMRMTHRSADRGAQLGIRRAALTAHLRRQLRPLRSASRPRQA